MHKKVSLYLVVTFLVGAQALYSQGLVFDDKSYDASPTKPRLMRGDYETLPLKASLKQYSPRPGNQLNYATSVGWALAWQARTILYAKNHRLTDETKIINHIHAPAYIYQKVNDKNEDCSQGITLEDGLKVLKNNGVPYFSDFLYFCGGEISNEIEKLAKRNVISDYAKLFERWDKNEDKINLVKKSIAEGYPVVAGMNTPSSFKRATEFWQPQEKATGKYEGHALCIIGYDDGKYGGAFEVVNSWGKNWGNNGYLWIRYEVFTEFVKEAYDLFSVPSDDHRKLEGSMDFKLESGDEMPVKRVEEGSYKMTEAYGSGTSFRVYISNEGPAFVYVFGSDLTKECFRIFPGDNRTSAALTYGSNHLAIPDENHFIQFDQTAGTDFLCVLYSKDELDLDLIMKEVKNSDGTFNERVQQTIGGTLLNKRVHWNDDAIHFKAEVSKGTVVATIVEIDHN